MANTIQSGIPGDINQVTRRKSLGSLAGIQQLTKQSIQPQNGAPTLGIAQPVPAQQLLAASGNPVRAAQMQSQFDQPVTKGDGEPPLTDRLTDVAGQAYKIAKPLVTPLATAGGILAAPVIDYARNTAIRAAGGDPATADGGETKYRDRAFDEVQPAINAAQNAGRSISNAAGGAVLSATGAKQVQPAPQQALASPGKPAAPSTPAAATAAPAVAQPTGYQNTGTPGIVAKKGVGGITELSNIGVDRNSAQGQFSAPRSGEPKAAAGGALAQLGSAGNIGDGVGVASFGTAGDSALSLERYAKANAIRSGIAEIAHRGEVGSGPGNVDQISNDALQKLSRTAAISSGRAGRIAAQDLESAQKLHGAQFAADLGEKAKQKPSWQNSAERAQAEAQTAKAQTEQQLLDASSQQQIARSKNIAALESVMVNPNASPDDQLRASTSYSALTSPSDKRYIEVRGGTNADGGKDASKVFDTRTGRYADGQQSGGIPKVGDVVDGHTFLGGDPADQRSWRKV